MMGRTMSTVEKVKGLMETEKFTLPQEFYEQLEEYEVFLEKMENAGVVPNKHRFTIPLIERIGTLNFAD